MTDGQYTVLLLILVLLGLEILRSQAVRDFFKNMLVTPFTQAGK